jgi:hypothetical protein
MACLALVVASLHAQAFGLFLAVGLRPGPFDPAHHGLEWRSGA